MGEKCIEMGKIKHFSEISLKKRYWFCSICHKKL